MEISVGEYGYVPDDVRVDHSTPAPTDVLQADATRCEGITGLLIVDGLCEATATPLSTHCAPSLHAHAACAAKRVRHVEYFHDHARIEHMLFDGALTPRDGALHPDLSRPGLGLEFKRADAQRLRRRHDADSAEWRSAGPTKRRAVHAPPPTPPRPDAVSGLADRRRSSTKLAAALRARVRGEVRFNDGDRALYSTDASNYRQIPIGVVLPRDADDVVETVAVCREFGAPIVSRGGATDLAGATCNAAVVHRHEQVHEPRARDRLGRTSGRASSRAPCSTICGIRRSSAISPSVPIRRRTTATRSAG